jgi:hypothetical protein
MTVHASPSRRALVVSALIARLHRSTLRGGEFFLNFPVAHEHMAQLCTKEF